MGSEREKEIEAYLVRRIQNRGGICWKFTSPGTKGVPDRICLIPGQVFFVEVKAPGAKHRRDEKMQEYRSRQIRSMGVGSYKVSSKEDVDRLMDVISL